MPTGQILICKVFVNKIIDDEKGDAYKFTHSPSVNMKKDKLDGLKYESIGSVLFKTEDKKENK